MKTKTHVSLRSTDVFRREGASIWGVRFAVGLLCLLGSCLLLGFTVVQKNLAYSSFGPAAVPGWGRGLLAWTIILFFIAVLIFFDFRIRRKFGLQVNKEGISFYRPFFAEVFVPWVSVHGIAFAQDEITWVPAKRVHRAILWLEDKQRVLLNKYANPRDVPLVVTRIKAELYPQLEIRERYALQAGDPINFGPIALQKSGVIIHNHSYPWEYIDQITVNHGFLNVILTDQKSIRLNIIDVPNLEIFITLVREFEQK